VYLGVLLLAGFLQHVVEREQEAAVQDLQAPRDGRSRRHFHCQGLLTLLEPLDVFQLQEGGVSGMTIGREIQGVTGAVRIGSERFGQNHQQQPPAFLFLTNTIQGSTVCNVCILQYCTECCTYQHSHLGDDVGNVVAPRKRSFCCCSRCSVSLLLLLLPLLLLLLLLRPAKSWKEAMADTGRTERASCAWADQGRGARARGRWRAAVCAAQEALLAAPRLPLWD